MNDTQPHNEARPNRSLWIRFYVGVVLFLGLIPPAAIESGRVMKTMENSPPHWLPSTVPARVNWDLFRQVFLDVDIMILSWPGCELETLAMDRVVDRIEAMDLEANPDGPPWFTRVTSGNDAMARLTQAPIGLSDRAAVARLTNTLVGPDGKTTCVLVPFTQAGENVRHDLIDRIQKIVEEEASVAPEDVHFAGPPTDGWHTDRATVQSMEMLTFPSWLIAAILAWICVRSIVLTLPVLLLSLIAQGTVLAIVSYSGAPMNAILIVLPPLVFVLTVSSGIHLSNYYLDVVREDANVSPEQAACRAIAIGSRPCWLAAGTTVIGLSSLMLVHIWPIAYFGAIASVGVLSMLGILILILPVAMIWDKRLRDRGNPLASSERKRIGKSKPLALLKLVLRSAIAVPMIVFMMFVFGSVVTGMGIPKLETSVNLPRMFSPLSRMRTDAAWLEKNLGPTIGAELMIRIPPEAFCSQSEDGVATPNPLKRLAFIAGVHSKLREASDDQGIISAMTFLPRPNMSRSVQGAANRAGLRQQITDPDSQLHRVGYINEKDGDQFWRITIRMPANEDISCVNEMVNVRRLLDPVFAAKGDGSTIAYTGAVPISGDAQALLLRDLFRSFLTTFAIVAVIMMIVLRSVAGGLLSMFPNLFPTLTLFGLMGWFGLPLDIGTVMTASVALGIAVDGTLHMLERFRQHDLEGASPGESAWRSLMQCGPAMWQTTIICGLSMMIYAYTDFVPTQQFAIMMFLLLVAALIGDAIILPAMMASPIGRTFRVRRGASDTS